MKKHLRIIVELGKVRIAVLATVTMIAGYILAHGAPSWALLALVAGVFLVACGSATINHIQDREIDSRMRRTQGRPLPSGRISRGYAWLVAINALAVGCLTLLAAANVTAMILGLLAVLWYNGVYTPLKRVSAFAAVPGGVVGAIPPIIGWVAGGGALLDPRILAVAFFFFMWQVPHFWLLILFSCGKDYERAGLPSLTRLFSLDQIARITFVWILATAVTCIMIPLFGIVQNAVVNFGLAAAGVWLIWRSSRILRHPDGLLSFRLAFKQINVYVLWVVSLLAVNGMIR